MTTTRILDTLALAYALQEHGRCQIRVAVDAEGHHTYATAPEAVAWCAWGAWKAATSELWTREEIEDAVVGGHPRLLNEAAQSLPGGEEFREEDGAFIQWHDALGRTDAQALELWGAAAALVGNK